MDWTCELTDQVHHQLIQSCAKGDLKTAKRCLEHNIIHTIDKNSGLSAASSNGKLEIVVFLLGQGANDISTAFLAACIAGHFEIVKWLASKCGLEAWKMGLVGCGLNQTQINTHPIIIYLLKRVDQFMSISNLLFFSPPKTLFPFLLAQNMIKLINNETTDVGCYIKQLITSKKIQQFIIKTLLKRFIPSFIIKIVLEPYTSY